MHLMMLLTCLQIKECIEAAKEVVKYFKNKTAVHGLLDKARKHVKVSVPVLRRHNMICITHCIRQHSQIVEAVAVVLHVYVKMSYDQCVWESGCGCRVPSASPCPCPHGGAA